MLESAITASAHPHGTGQTDARAMAHLSPAAGDDDVKAVFKAGRNERMAGSVPVWDSKETAKDEVLTTIAAARTPEAPVTSALTYTDATQSVPDNRYGKPFGFGDLVDMANPLQHIPVVGHVYRGLTGDEISPAARVIGGSVYGGFLGGAAAMADVIVEHESGRGLADTVTGMVRGDRRTPDTPPNTLLAAQEYAALHDAGERTAGFSKFKDTARQERQPSADSVTAPQKAAKQASTQTSARHPEAPGHLTPDGSAGDNGIHGTTAREAITTINFSPLPPLPGRQTSGTDI